MTPVPRREEIAAGEILVHVLDSRPDSAGRVRVIVFWLDPLTPAGVRGQVQRCDLPTLTADAERRGLAVRRWTPPDLG